MSTSQADCIIGMEAECLTALPENPNGTGEAMRQFLVHLAHLCPSLPAAQGIFTPYGRVYRDLEHIEFATIECDSPYTVPVIMERLQSLAAQAVAQMAAGGIKFVLANNCHSGTLHSGCAMWGHHENYLVDESPSLFTPRILPFLVTRIYGGAGGIHHPTGCFLAGVRSTCLEAVEGGGTTAVRAIQSLAREEHHLGPALGGHRYHLILGDGHRSHFNLALQLGATMLAVKAVTWDWEFCREIAAVCHGYSSDWLKTLNQMNVLARGGEPPRVHPFVCHVQQLYLEGVRRWATRLRDVPDWIPRLLRDWEQTLTALESMDRVWLSRHLDAFAKYEFYTAVLAGQGLTFADLYKKPNVFFELALLDQNYHEFCNESSVFTQLERAGKVDHRVAPYIEPGDEPEPFVPEVNTRARPRARFIREHRGNNEFLVDWSSIRNVACDQLIRLDDPYCQRLGSWFSAPTSLALALGEWHSDVTFSGPFVRCCEQGRYEEALFLLNRAEHGYRTMSGELPRDLAQGKAWLLARCGFAGGLPLLQQAFREQQLGLRQVIAYCRVYRFSGLVPDLEQMAPWMERGHQLLVSGQVEDDEEELAVEFRELAAVALLRHGWLREAQALLEPALTRDVRARIGSALHARVLAACGELYRRSGERHRARTRLHAAMRIEAEHGFEGQLSYSTLLSLAKYEKLPPRALDWVEQAGEIQVRNEDRVGHTFSLLLEARLCGDATHAEDCLRQVRHYRSLLPALAQCPLLARILEAWDAWTAGAIPAFAGDPFWGL